MPGLARALRSSGNNARRPVTFDDRAASVLAVLNLPKSDPPLLRRVRTFIECNGYEAILRAARYTAARAAKEPVHDPWAYTINVYNNNLARLEHLYVLTHWAENGLRSQVDLRMSAALGETWYRFPERYLPANQVDYFFGDASHRDLRWEADTHAARGRRVADLANPAEFLEQITLGWLTRIVVHNYHSYLRGILITLAGAPVTRDEAAALLDAAKTARNAVAHNRYLTNEQYRMAVAKLPRLLELLRFDVSKALQRIEGSRRVVVRRTLTELGALPQSSQSP